jgi:hypothetical protein
VEDSEAERVGWVESAVDWEGLDSAASADSAALVASDGTNSVARIKAKGKAKGHSVLQFARTFQ